MTSLHIRVEKSHRITQQASEDRNSRANVIDILRGKAPTHVRCSCHSNTLHARLEKINVLQHSHKRAFSEKRRPMFRGELLQRLRNTPPLLKIRSVATQHGR